MLASVTMCNDDIRNYNSKISDLGSLTLLILSKTDLMHIGNIEIFYFIMEQPIPEPENIRD